MAFRFRNSVTTYDLQTGEPGAGEYIFGWGVSLPGWSPRLSLSERIQQDGAAVSSDRRTGSRDLSLTFDAASKGTASIATMRAAFNSLVAFFRPSLAPFYLEDTTNGIRCRVELKGLNPAASPATLWKMMEKNSVSLSMISAFWEDLTASTLSATGGLANNGTLVVNNTGSFECFPTYTITALADITLFRITNSTTGLGFELEDLGFGTNSVFIFDTQTGEITLDGEERSASLVSGGPVYLSPGSNTLTYESNDGSVSLSVSWRRRYVW